MNLETDFVSASGWIVRTGRFEFESKRRTIHLAFEDFIASTRPRAIGTLVWFVPIGEEETDANTVVGFSKPFLGRTTRDWP